MTKEHRHTNTSWLFQSHNSVKTNWSFRCFYFEIRTHIKGIKTDCCSSTLGCAGDIPESLWIVSRVVLFCRRLHFMASGIVLSCCWYKTPKLPDYCFIIKAFYITNNRNFIMKHLKQREEGSVFLLLWPPSFRSLFHDTRAMCSTPSSLHFLSLTFDALEFMYKCL